MSPPQSKRLFGVRGEVASAVGTPESSPFRRKQKIPRMFRRGSEGGHIKQFLEAILPALSVRTRRLPGLPNRSESGSGELSLAEVAL